MSNFDTQRLASELLASAHQAGHRIMSHYGRVDVELKDDKSPVTAADREADRILVESLKRIAPDIPVISEESSPKQEIDPQALFFLVDPLDGTKEFIRGRDEFTVNVALIEHGTPIFGLVYAPALSKLYVTLAPDKAVMARLDASQPAPDFSGLDLTPIAAQTVDPSALTAAVSRSHMDEQTQSFLDENGITETHASGSSLKFCCLAEGLADVYPRFGRTMEWDTAAGHSVLKAAGGAVLDTEGAPLTYGKRDEDYANPGFIAWGKTP
jgi:3'(2'), 5'-bisphosphate nucleotidase